MHTFRNIFRTCTYIRSYSSALYITGDKASANFAALTPYLDFDERLKNRTELEENIKLRKKNINLDKYVKYWDFYKHLSENLLILEATKHSISEDLSKLMHDPEKNKDEIEKLKLHAKTAKDNYKNLRDYFYPVEEVAAINALAIPNILDNRTPHQDPVLLYKYKEKPTEKSQHHIHLAQDANLLHYVNPMFLFLKNDAALFEHAIINCTKELFSRNTFIPTVNASFVRSIIAEGCCTDYSNQNAIFTVHEDDAKFSVNKLHLVGNASIHSFVAYLTKFSIQLGYFPLKFFTAGKEYHPVKTNEASLHNLSQYSVTDGILLYKENDSEDELFNQLINIVKEFYDSLGYHYQLVYYPANKLENYESLRLSIQMYSMHFQSYVEVGHISLCGNYLSKRLLVTYSEDKIRKYANIIYCRLTNVQKLLACILEYNDVYKWNLLTDKLREHVPM